MANIDDLRQKQYALEAEKAKAKEEAMAASGKWDELKQSMVKSHSDEIDYFCNMLKESLAYLDKMVKLPAVERNSAEFEK